MPIVQSPGTDEYWSIGKLKRYLHIAEYNMLRYLALERVRVFAPSGWNIKYNVLDVRDCLRDEFGEERAELKSQAPPPKHGRMGISPYWHVPLMSGK